LSAPATELAKVLDLQGIRELLGPRVKALIVCDTGAAQDPKAIRRVLADWPTPIVFCGREVGEAALFPASSIEKDFTWAPANPIVDAYTAYKPMPYDAPSYDMAAVLYAGRMGKDLFQLSEPGTTEVAADGRLRFTKSPGGKHRSLIVDPAQRQSIVDAYIELASAKPVVRQPFRRPQKKAEDEKKAQQKED
jgi:hypothetical protein